MVASAGESLPPSASCKQLGAFSFPWLLASSNLIAIDSRCSAYATNWAGHSPRNLEWNPEPNTNKCFGNTLQLLLLGTFAIVPHHWLYWKMRWTPTNTSRCAVLVRSSSVWFVQLVEEKSCMPKTVIDTVHTLNKNPEKSGDPKSGSCLVVPFIPNGLPFFARALGMLSSVEIVIPAHLDLEAAAV